MLEDTQELLLNMLSKDKENLEYYKWMQEVFECGLEAIDDYANYNAKKEIFKLVCSGLCLGITSLGSLIVYKILEPLVGNLIADCISVFYISSAAIVFVDKIDNILHQRAKIKRLDKNDFHQIMERRKEVEQYLSETRAKVVIAQNKLLNTEKQNAFVENSIGLEILSEEKIKEFYNELKEELNVLLNEYMKLPSDSSEVRFVEEYTPILDTKDNLELSKEELEELYEEYIREYVKPEEVCFRDDYIQPITLKNKVK